MLIEEITNHKASELIGKIDTLALPVGTLEAHGPHCSVMADVLIPKRMSEEVEKLAGDRVFIAPVIPYGHTWHLQDRPGSHNISFNVLSDYVYEVMKGFREGWKIRYVILLDGHGGNTEALAYAAERATALGMKTAILSWWTRGFVEKLRVVMKEPEGHAGEAETSLLWFVGDRYVDEKIIPKTPNRYNYAKGRTAATLMDIYDPSVGKAAFPDAYSGNPGGASREKGRLLMEKSAEIVVEVIDALRAGKVLDLS